MYTLRASSLVLNRLTSRLVSSQEPASFSRYSVSLSQQPASFSQDSASRTGPNSARLHSDAVWLHGCMCSRWPGEPPVRSARARESPCGTCSAGTPESCVLKQHGPGTEVACAGQALIDGQATKQWISAPHGHGWSMYTKPNTP